MGIILVILLGVVGRRKERDVKAAAVLGAASLIVAAATTVLGQEIKDPSPPMGSPGGAVRSTGGPDAFGYTYSGGGEADVTYDWVEITGTGTVVVSGDDTVVRFENGRAPPGCIQEVPALNAWRIGARWR